MLQLLLGAALVAGPLPPPDTVPRDSTTRGVTQRRKAVEYSDWYAVRLKVHRIGSYAEFPIFAAQYVVGQRLMNSNPRSDALQGTHGVLTATTGFLFATNSATGLWNLWDSRQDSAGRTRRFIHSALMIASDAGFLWTAGLADDDQVGGSSTRRHRQAAIASMSLSAAGTLMMWLWRD